ncbi:MAG: Bacterial membrane flanked domain protein [Firmicutes bacterium ADurb.Bin300]|nr:MAG: Bacterial membrane flanked domain protein [Firmicutes bacterium ADurb.Bin300]
MRYTKYDNGFAPIENDISGLLMENEQVLWSGKPKKNAFIINKSLVMMPFALLWFCFDAFFIGTMASTGSMKKMWLFIIPFFAFHLMPVWIWLWNVLSANRQWKNTEYAVTDKRIIIRGGVLGYNFQNIYYTEINSVDLHVGIIDRMLGVGDIIVNPVVKTAQKSRSPAILDIENPYELFGKIQKTVLDIQTDIHYPNELRPNQNRGYDTEYRP